MRTRKKKTSTKIKNRCLVAIVFTQMRQMVKFDIVSVRLDHAFDSVDRQQSTASFSFFADDDLDLKKKEKCDLDFKKKF